MGSLLPRLGDKEMLPRYNPRVSIHDTVELKDADLSCLPLLVRDREEYDRQFPRSCLPPTLPAAASEQ